MSRLEEGRVAGEKVGRFVRLQADAYTVRFSSGLNVHGRKKNERTVPEAMLHLAVARVTHVRPGCLVHGGCAHACQRTVGGKSLCEIDVQPDGQVGLWDFRRGESDSLKFVQVSQNRAEQGTDCQVPA